MIPESEAELEPEQVAVANSVDGAAGKLAGLADKSIDEQLAVLEQVHTQLKDSLNRADAGH